MGQVQKIIFLLSVCLIPLYVSGQYCTPTYHNVCNAPFSNSFIEDVTINTLRNIGSGCGSANNYINYPVSEFTTTLEQGGEYELMFRCRSDEYIRLYFDFNKDFDFRDPGEFFDVGEVEDEPVYYKVIIPATAIGEVRMRVRSGDATTTSTHDCNVMYWGETEDYTVTIVPPFAMSYTTSHIIQDSSYVFPGNTQQKIIGVEIEAQGSLSPLNLTGLDFNTSGTTDLADISNARVFYTGTDRTFSTTSEFGISVSAPSGNFSFFGSQPLQQGKNFFWLVYDVRNEAFLDNYIDASCLSIEIDGISYSPVNPSPSGKRKVFNYTLIKDGSENVGRIYFMDDGDELDNYTRTDYTFTVYPEQAGAFVQVEFLEFNLSEIAEVGCELLHIYNGNSTSAPEIGVFCSDSPETIVSTSVDGSLTFRFQINTFAGASSPGWKALFTNVSNLPTAFISGNAIINKGETANISLSMTGFPPYTIVYTNGISQDTISAISATHHSFAASDAGTYTIMKVFDGLNREGTFSGSAVIQVINDIIAPEGISPNGDNYNEFFVIEGIEGKKVALHVYNREGGLVYSNDNYSNEWYGENNFGNRLPDGTYYYVITVEGELKRIKNYLEIRR